MTTPCPRRGKACGQQNKTCLAPFCCARLGSASLGLGGLGFWSARLWFEDCVASLGFEACGGLLVCGSRPVRRTATRMVSAAHWLTRRALPRMTTPSTAVLRVLVW